MSILNLRRNRRFNTHVSALFTQNQTLREQYEPLCILAIKAVANKTHRMLSDMRDLIQRYG